MAHAAVKNPDKRLVFAYEQAIGYLVTGRPLDKDGVTAAVLMAELASVLASEGSSLEGRLDEIAEKYGRHICGEVSVKMDPVQGAKTVAKLREKPPAEIGGKTVVSVKEFPEANLLRIWLGEEGGKGVRVQIDPAGPSPRSSCMVRVLGQTPPLTCWRQLACCRPRSLHWDVIQHCNVGQLLELCPSRLFVA